MGVIYLLASSTILSIMLSIGLHFLKKLEIFKIYCTVCAIMTGIVFILAVCAAVDTNKSEEDFREDLMNEYTVLTTCMNGINEDASLADRFLIYEKIEKYNNKIELHNEKNKSYWFGAFWEDCSDMPLIKIEEEYFTN